MAPGAFVSSPVGLVKKIAKLNRRLVLPLLGLKGCELVTSIEPFRRIDEVNLAPVVEPDAEAAPPGSPLASTALPEYVEHKEGVSRVGAVTAEAIVRDYEAAAKEIEAMGAELISAARKCEAMTAEVHNAIAYMRDTAIAYRAEAKKIFNRIEHCALLTEEVRMACENIKRRMIEHNQTPNERPQGQAE